MHQNAFGGRPAGVTYSAPPDPLAELKGGRRGVRKRKGREGEGRGGRVETREEGGERGGSPMFEVR